MLAEYKRTKTILDDIQEENGRRAILFSGARWLEQGEKPTRYFFGLCAKRNANKSINILQTGDGEILSESKEILRLCKEHFEEVYTSRLVGQYLSSNGPDVSGFNWPVQDYFTIKVCSVGKSDRRRGVTQGNPLRLFEWGFNIGYFPNIYGDFCTFSCFSLDTEDQIFQ